jgi:hypothetical protein
LSSVLDTGLMPDPASRSVSLAGYEVTASSEEPLILDDLRRRARMSEHFDLEDVDSSSGWSFFAVRREPAEWPQLVVTQRYQPAGSGYTPGVLIVPSTGVIFIGARGRLLAYSSNDDRWARLWIDAAEWFWGWRQQGAFVLMSAELELAAWTTAGEKLWSTFVEPPWSYSVQDSTVNVDVMGAVRRFPLAAGP